MADDKSQILGCISPSRRQREVFYTEHEVEGTLGYFPSSRRWAEKQRKNIVYWNELGRGGHFMALERPDDFVQEVRQSLRFCRSGSCRVESN